MVKENEFILILCRLIVDGIVLENKIKDKATESKIIDKTNKLRDLIEGGLDYPYILGHLLYNRLGGGAYYTLDRHSLFGGLSREFVNTLRTVYRANRVKCSSYNLALEYIDGVFANINFPYALLKGSYLSRLYPKGVRTSNDIDVLIDRKNSSDLAKVLAKFGFVQGYVRNGKFTKATRAQIILSQLNRGESVPFVKELKLNGMKFLELDINFSLDYKPESDKKIVSKMLKDAEKIIKTFFGYLYALCPEDFLIQLCVHLYKEASIYNWVEMGRDQGLYKYLDIYLLSCLKTDKVLNKTLVDKIKEYGLEKECYYALSGTSELFGMSYGADIIESIKPEDTSFINEIYKPDDKKVYRFDMCFTDWVFCGKRSAFLYEA